MLSPTSMSAMSMDTISKAVCESRRRANTAFEITSGFANTTGSGNTVNRVALWNGSSWESLGTGMNGLVNALAVYNGKLYAGGHFMQAGGSPALRIACWDGEDWNPVGSYSPAHTGGSSATSTSQPASA
jgi:hypothetical protein